MEIKYEKDIIVKIIPSASLTWTKDTLKEENIPWTYLEGKYTKFQVNVWKEIGKVKWGKRRRIKILR